MDNGNEVGAYEFDRNALDNIARRRQDRPRKKYSQHRPVDEFGVHKFARANNLSQFTACQLEDALSKERCHMDDLVNLLRQSSDMDAKQLLGDIGRNAGTMTY